MTDDIVARLRSWDHCWPADWLEHSVVEAADEIERLRAEVERLTQERDDLDARLTELFASSVSYIRKKHDAVARAEAAEQKVAMLRDALRPFALAASMIADGFPDHDIMPMRLGQCRDARAAIKETEQ